jgi:hypothetical protein
MAQTIKHVVKLYQAGSLSRREYRSVLAPLLNWCDKNVNANFSMYYTNRGERHSLWCFENRADADLFKREFGGIYSQHVKQGKREAA